MLAGTTTFLIAQRVSSVLAADQILVLEQGPRLEDREFDGSEVSMPAALYEDGEERLVSAER